KELQQYLSRYPDTQFVDALTFSLSGTAVGKRYPIAELPALMQSGLQFCPAMMLVDASGETRDIEGLGFSDGDPDAPAQAIAGTLAPVPWATEPTAQFLFDMQNEHDPTGFWSDPRAILKRVVAMIQALGLRPVVACELEFYLLDATRNNNGRVRPPAQLQSGRYNKAPRVFSFAKLDEFNEFIAALEKCAKAQGLPTGAITSEYGGAQFEINLQHSDNPLIACDQAMLLRRAVRGVAQSMGLDASFMSKPFADQAGNGLHIHMSLIDSNGNNVFDNRSAKGDKNLRHAIGGMQATMYEAMAIFAPNLNAFRRFSANNFLPVNKYWGENNRSVAFRVPLSKPSSRRIEHRVAGADANPYLVMAVVLASVHLGLSQQLDCGPAFQGNAGEQIDADMPVKLWTAIERLRTSNTLADYLGQQYVRAYADLKEAEFSAFMANVFVREYDWYL
ncbi:MAG: glutamine synthetase family protein, partial [Granulosicoccus sp.]